MAIFATDEPGQLPSVATRLSFNFKQMEGDEWDEI